MSVHSQGKLLCINTCMPNNVQNKVYIMKKTTRNKSSIYVQENR